MSDAKFIGGLLVKAPHDRAPEYVKAKLSIRRAELIAWLETEQGEWINADIKVSQSGKWYCAIDDWKPDVNRQGATRSSSAAPQRRQPAPPRDDFEDSEIPF